MIIGFSGHQKIDDPDRWGWVAEQFAAILRKHAAADTTILACLAAGGDQLFVRTGLELGLPAHIVIPCQGYEGTFHQPAAKAAYRELLAGAADVVTLPFNEPSEDAYLAAGIFVVDKAAILVTLWNGKPAAGKGGTGDMVEYAKAKGRSIIHVHPDLQEVFEL